MTLLNFATAACCITVLGAALAPSAKADEWNRKTTVTFSGPVEIPRVHLAGWGVLPAGTYVFKILDSQSNRHVVQIFSKDEKTVYATILAIPNYRLKVTDKTVITFRERAAGEPEALRAWFYPGRNWGEEFVYPKSKALELAKASNAPVLFTPVDLPSEVSAPILSASEPVVVELKRAPIMAIQPTGQEVELSEVVTAPPEESTEAAGPDATQEPRVASTASQEPLPATASELPIVVLFGLLALGGAFAVRPVMKRML